MKEYLEIFITFARLGLLTFGGGYAMIPVVERELIKRKGWTTMEEVMDYYTIAQITPGIIAVNLSTFVGCKRKGPLGGFVSTLGFIMPGTTLITLIALFIQNFADIPAVAHAFAGLRIAAGALILDTAIKMVKGILKNPAALPLFIAAFVLSFFWRVSPVLIVLGAGLVGLLVCRPWKRQNRRPKPAPRGTGVSGESPGGEKEKP